MNEIKNKVIVICGPTAVGKTKVAIDIAAHFKTQIISADSRQCFKELNIGVAKPSETELNAITHYFINSHSIHENVNAMVFENYALNKVDEICKHNNIAVMVGGTGLYIKAFCEGMDAMPTIDSELREKIFNEYSSKGLVWLQQKLQQKDPLFWQVAEQKNPQRLMRALEIVETTGISNLQFRKGKQSHRNFDIIKIGLNTSRTQLYHQINTRVDEMMQQGLLQEVEQLISYQHLNALQTVGYKEFFNYFNAQHTLQQAIELVKINTRQYAKRQLTWFNKDEAVQWFQPNEVDTIIHAIKAKIN